MPPLTPFFSPTNSLLAVLLLIAFPAHGSQLHHLQINDTYPEDSISWGHVLRRDASVARRLRIEQPTAVRKMTDDEGEKFWMGYWGFDVKYNGNRDVEDIQRGGRELRNETMLQPAYPVHGAQRHVWFGRELAIMKYLQSSRVFSKRGFNCPTNTQPCTSISRPNSCCALGTTCQIIPNTGLGDVGCCPGSSTTCSGQIKSCPDGYANCAGFPGGGCCIPGYSCVSNGCLFVSTTTVTVTASTPSSTSTSTSSASSTQISPPTRPTSNPVTTATVSPAPTSTSTSEIPDICPTGFYACNAAYYPGGCCRTGRDCNPTSCPPLTPYTTVDTNGVTVVVSVPATATPPARQCAGGWASCGADVGGGCCPDGFRCGRESCTRAPRTTGEGPTPSGEAVVAKVPPQSGGRRLHAGVLGSLAEPRYFWAGAVGALVVVGWF